MRLWVEPVSDMLVLTFSLVLLLLPLLLQLDELVVCDQTELVPRQQEQVLVGLLLFQLLLILLRSGLFTQLLLLGRLLVLQLLLVVVFLHECYTPLLHEVALFELLLPELLNRLLLVVLASAQVRWHFVKEDRALVLVTIRHVLRLPLVLVSRH